MSYKAEELLLKMKTDYNSNGKTSFDSDFYLGYSDSVLTELYNDGYIEIKNDVVGTIELITK